MQLSNDFLVQFVAKKRWLRRLNMFSLPKLTFINFGGNKFYLDPNDWKGPSYHVLNWGLDSYETTNISLVKNFFKSIDEDGVFFDIGSNIGIFSFLLSLQNEKTHIFAFEPEPVALNCLRSTFAATKLKNNVHIESIALSDSNGFADFFVDSANHGGHSLNSNSISDEGNAISKSIRVASETLDSYVNRKQISKIDFIKMDVQRHEGMVLKGASSVIQKMRPTILMECYFAELLADNSPLLGPFKDQNYEIVEPKSKKAYSLSKSDLTDLNQNNSEYCDLVFIPKEKKHHVV